MVLHVRTLRQKHSTMFNHLKYFHLLNLQIIFEGIAGTGFYGSDIAIDDISVLNAVNCTFSPPEARPVPVVTPNRSKSRKYW